MSPAAPSEAVSFLTWPSYLRRPVAGEDVRRACSELANIGAKSPDHQRVAADGRRDPEDVEKRAVGGGQLLTWPSYLRHPVAGEDVGRA